MDYIRRVPIISESFSVFLSNSSSFPPKRTHRYASGFFVWHLNFSWSLGPGRTHRWVLPGNSSYFNVSPLICFLVLFRWIRGFRRILGHWYLYHRPFLQVLPFILVATSVDLDSSSIRVCFPSFSATFNSSISSASHPPMSCATSRTIFFYSAGPVTIFAPSVVPAVFIQPLFPPFVAPHVLPSCPAVIPFLF